VPWENPLVSVFGVCGSGDARSRPLVFSLVVGSGAEPRLLLTSTTYLAVFLPVSYLIVSHSDLESPWRFTVGSQGAGMVYTVFVVEVVGSSTAVSIFWNTRELVRSNSIQGHGPL
jgi:hypothetical protein